MQLYKTSGVDPEDDKLKVKWSGTQADARKDKNAMVAQHFSHVESEPVNVPVDKPRLLDWLNNHQELEDQITWTGLRAIT